MLTPKQAAFATEYVKDGNATQAAIRAGYSARTASQTGYELLRHPEIIPVIADTAEARLARAGMTAERVLTEFAAIGFARLTDILSWDGSTVRVIPSDELSPAALASIKSVKIKRTRLKSDPRGDEAWETEEIEFTQHGKQPALEALAKRLNLYPPKQSQHEVTGRDGGPIEVDQRVLHLTALRDDLLKLASEG